MMSLRDPACPVELFGAAAKPLIWIFVVGSVFKDWKCFKLTTFGWWWVSDFARPSLSAWIGWSSRKAKEKLCDAPDHHLNRLTVCNAAIVFAVQYSKPLYWLDRHNRLTARHNEAMLQYSKIFGKYKSHKIIQTFNFKLTWLPFKLFGRAMLQCCNSIALLYNMWHIQARQNHSNL